MIQRLTFLRSIHRIIQGLIFLIPSLVWATSPIISASGIHQPVQARQGMVVSQSPLASHVGRDILSQGGNAVDAAVAMGFALAVTLPQAGNLGGGGFMMIHLNEPSRTIAIDFREMAPIKAHQHMFLNSDGDVDHQRSRFSILSSGVPGSVPGLLHALNQYGTFKRGPIIAPAIQLADGFPVSQTFHNTLKKAQKRLKKQAYTHAIFYPQGQVPKVGSQFIQNDLKTSLKEIQKKGASALIDGDIAKKLIQFMKTNGGLITAKDLNAYQVKERPPIQGSYRGYTVYSMPPPSSGGLILMQMLKILEPYPIETWGHHSANTIHVMTEAMSLAYADRAQWLGDPDMVDVPTQNLLSKAYIDARRATISMSAHRPSKMITFGPAEGPNTTHYSVVDKWGNAVSVTTTLNFSFGSGFSIPGTGILLNNEMDDFSAKPGVPNAYGLIGNEKNAIAPKKRMLSSMTPTIILDNQKVFLVTGSPGGSRIITTVLQLISNVIDHKMNIADASHAPRFHHQWQPDYIRIESPGFSSDTLSILRQKGHKIHVKRPMGSTQSILKRGDTLYGASDPRKSGLALGLDI